MFYDGKINCITNTLVHDLVNKSVVQVFYIYWHRSEKMIIEGVRFKMRVHKNSVASLWKFRLSTTAVVLIPAAVGINYVAKAFAEGLKLPLWLGTLGTYLASMLAGPIPGAISGFINNIIYGLTLSPISTVYSITSVGIGLAVGWLFYRGWFDSPKKVWIAGLIIALVSAVISTPLNVIFYGGQTGVVWGDALFAILVAHSTPVWIASFIDEFVLDILDKVVVGYLAYFIYRQLPKKLIYFFRN